MSTDDTIPRREIKSFVKRIGRITAGQKLALEIQWPRYGLDYTGAPRDLAAIFGNDLPHAALHSFERATGGRATMSTRLGRAR